MCFKDEGGEELSPSIYLSIHYYYYYIYIALIEFAIMLNIYNTLHVFGSGLLPVLCHANMRRATSSEINSPEKYTGLQVTHSGQ